MFRGYFIAALCPLMLTLGCTTTMNEQLSPASGLAKLRPNPDRINLTAASEGTLRMENGCFKLELREGHSLSIVWPENAALMGEGRGVQVGNAQFKAGDHIRLGGSAAEKVPSTEVEMIGTFNCEGPYFIASSVR